MIVLANCMEEMRKLRDGSIDLILTDPPYNATNIGKKAKPRVQNHMKPMPLQEYIEFCHQWFSEAQRVAKRIVFTPGISNVCYYPQPKWIACWHKPGSTGFNRFGGFNAWEPIMLYGSLPKGHHLPQDYIYQLTLNFKKGLESAHPCPKPIRLIRRLVDIFSAPGELVLDPFMGSGTTGVASLQAGRVFMGYEINKDYFDIAERRISEVENQAKL